MLEQRDYNVLTKNTGNKEVVRISIRNDGKDNESVAGKISSYVLKALILDNKDVYISYISSATSKLPMLVLKTEKVKLLIGRMLTDSLERICGGPDKVPAKYANKKLTVMFGAPYNKKADITELVKSDDGKKSFKKIEGFEDKEVTATYQRVYLVEVNNMEE